ncbi:MAG: DUF3168 domain-containing protein [Burkholderiales bacterium]|jgi:hypothetical protein|nr:DUF3168 domain-containing protein [Burkholderiales bacterium]
MRSVEEIIAAALKSVPALGGRVYPLVADQGVARPYAVWTVVSKAEGTDFDGAINLAEVYFQVDVYALTPSECASVAATCRVALISLKECNCKTEVFGKMGYEGDTKLYRDSSDYQILVESED